MYAPAIKTIYKAKTGPSEITVSDGNITLTDKLCDNEIIIGVAQWPTLVQTVEDMLRLSRK